MNKLFIYYVSLVVLIFMASPAFSIQYCKDFLEPGNSGGWGTSIKTWEDELTLAVTEEVDVDIWINDVPRRLLLEVFLLF